MWAGKQINFCSEKSVSKSNNIWPTSNDKQLCAQRPFIFGSTDSEDDASRPNRTLPESDEKPTLTVAPIIVGSSKGLEDTPSALPSPSVS